MSDFKREITAKNVDRLVDAHKAERERIDSLQRRIVELEKQVQSLLIKLNAVQQQSITSFAIVKQLQQGNIYNGDNS